MRFSLFPIVSLLCSTAWAQPGTITTLAGNGFAGFGGDGGPATQASFNRSVYVHYDVFGNLYIADENNQRIRKMDRNGTITTFAGNGQQGFSGDGGPATQASLNGPNGVCSDPNGNVYINDTLNQRIRRVDLNGIITTYAGNGSTSSGGDGGQATSAGIWLPIRCDFGGPNGFLFVAEQGGHKIRRILPNGIINTIAGNGTRTYSGDGGPATSAGLDNPTAVVVDRLGDVYFSDQSNHRIRKISGGTITTYAGNGQNNYNGDGGPAGQASIRFPGGLALDQKGTLYVTEAASSRIRRIAPDGTITTLAGIGQDGYTGDGGPANQARLNGPFGIDIAPNGDIVFADTLNNRIRSISPLAPSTAPAFTPQGATNSASFISGLTPGGLGTIFGSNLSAANGGYTTNQAPWPTSLAGVSVNVGGFAARLYSIANVDNQEQISFQVPFEIAGQSQVSVTVTNNGVTSNTVQVNALSAQPGIFLIDGFHGAFLHPADFSLVTGQNPAAKGEYIAMYLTGLGAVDQPVATGDIAPDAEPFARTTTIPTVTVGGAPAEVIYSGLAPGFIGLYQINFRVPENAATGAAIVKVTSGQTDSNLARIEVQ